MARADYTIQNMKTSVCASLLLTHLMAFAALFFWSWPAFKVSMVLALITQWFGVSMGNHRLFTHKSFRAPKWVSNTIAWVATTAGQGGILFWVGVHQLHHRWSDKPEDPHSPRDGFGWAHVFWLCFKRVDGQNPLRQVPELLEDPFLRWLEGYSWIPQATLSIVVFTLGYLLGGVREAVAWVLWCVGVRTAITYHVTWFVNSACHTWGYKNHPSEDDSRNLWWVSLLTGGEGWHANHHYDRRSASHGMRRWEIDPIYWVIVMMSWVGLAGDVIRPRDWRTIHRV